MWMITNLCVYDFYPRPPRGGRRFRAYDRQRIVPISTHALREEGDAGLPGCAGGRENFYPRPPRGGRQFSFGRGIPLPKFLPTPSARRATADFAVIRGFGSISTHALREEGDRRFCCHQRIRQYFYPRPPRGGRPCTCSLSSRQQIFLPTPSARRATGIDNGFRGAGNISTHALREEGDQRGEATAPDHAISTHALREEGDLGIAIGAAEHRMISTHALREEGDRSARRLPS